MNIGTFAALAAPLALLIGASTAMAQSAPPSMGDQDGIVGPAFRVSDLAKSLKFYKDVLGMTVTMQFGSDGKPLDLRERAARNQLGEGLANTTLAFGTNPMNPMIMLLPESPNSPHKIEHGYGYARTAIRFADLPALNEKLKAAGFAPGEIRGAHGMFQVMFVRDPDGYVLEFIERKPRK